MRPNFVRPQFSFQRRGGAGRGGGCGARALMPRIDFIFRREKTKKVRKARVLSGIYQIVINRMLYGPSPPLDFAPRDGR